MLSRKREFFTYEVKDGNKVVYIGKTNDLDDTEQRHKDDGKKFTKIIKTSVKMKEESAFDRETENLEKFRKTHKGKNPKYNKTKKG